MPSVSTELLVIGAGCTGLGIAWDACLRGFKVVVVDQANVGQGTSGRYHGLLHSGGRYAISDPKTARDCNQENSILRRIAPHTIEDTGGFFISLQDDSEQYADRWFLACREIGIAAERLSPDLARKLEPCLSPDISQVFRVNDASLDSFDLLHSLTNAIRHAGGQVWLRHRVVNFILHGDRVVALELYSEDTHETVQVGADFVVNASGPWIDEVANLAGASAPVTYSKGTLLAMANRLSHTVLNRCRPPTDGDIIVPVGTVIVLGTTDIPVGSPSELDINPSEIDFLLKQGEAILPGLSERRALRAWTGIRPLYSRDRQNPSSTRELSRSHVIIDHAETDGVSALISIFGGKLTTYRMMAQQAVDVVSEKLGIETKCSTDSVPLETDRQEYFHLPDRLNALIGTDHDEKSSVVCECEIVTRAQIEKALHSQPHLDLDDLRRTTRLGMGPCQAGFCAMRAAGIAHEMQNSETLNSDLKSFLDNRWRGSVPVAWGHTLRQMELTRRLYLELLNADQIMGDER